MLGAEQSVELRQDQQPDDNGAELADVKHGLKQLVKLGAINGYGPLVEVKGARVAQAENSVLVDDDGKVFVTTRLV